MGNTPSTSFATVTKDAFSGDGSETEFTLSKVATTNSVSVFVENVRQEPTTAYAVSGTTLTFTAAPVSASGNNIYVLHMLPTSTATHPAAQNLTAVDGTFTGDVSIDGGSFVFNESSADKDFRVESNGNTHMLFVDGGNDKVMIGLETPEVFNGTTPPLQIEGVDNNKASLSITRNSNDNGQPLLIFSKSRGAAVNSDTIVASGDIIGEIVWLGADGNDRNSQAAYIQGKVGGTPGSDDMPGELLFGTTADGAASATGRMVINSVGNVFTGSLNNVFSGDDRYGANFFTSGENSFSSNVANAVYINRDNNDGDIISFYRARSAVGTISVSGSTVSYNAFTGSHWSRLTDNSKPTILKGTVVETIDEMCDWYQVEFTVTEKNEDGEDVDVVKKHSITLPDGKKEGDTISYTVPEGSPALIDKNDVGKTYSGKLIKEDDFKHVKCKISDTADCTNVYGVFSSWDNDDDTVNDMYVNAVGTALVRIHKDQTVSKGDLITSNGDGTAKVQDDDIIRSKTIGKVLANIKQETYSDGSYTVPCALYCG
jgi:hypothetical protein